MRYLNILICFGLLVISIKAFAQNIQNPSLSVKNHTTLVIDSIPVTTPKTYQLSGVNKLTSDYRLFLGASHISGHPFFGTSKIRSYLIIPNTAFTHESLFDPIVYNSLQHQSWDNPHGADSFAVGILYGSLQLMSTIFAK
ncbi:hypothetical protein [Aquimarina sp. AU474]|uniref:hypothetical protein n=1 Tax=Aquimarina sp. AU474 TaxID=2108529 RepID=UPI000D69A6D8|nr:hypothetical protein [Aquimarina sp. AU474]